MDVDLVIFDKDGTLIDIHHYWGGMVKLRAEILSKKYVESRNQQKATNALMSAMGINLNTGKIKSSGPVGINPREFIIDIAFQTMTTFCDKITLEQVSSVFQKVDSYSQRHLEELVRPLPGVKEFLKELKRREIKTAIATTDLTIRAKLAMNSIGLLHYFDDIAGADIVGKAKPSPDLVNYICKKLFSSKGRTIVIGDSIADLQMAKSASVRFIGVKTGLHTPEFLENSEFLIDSLLDVGIL